MISYEDLCHTGEIRLKSGCVWQLCGALGTAVFDVWSTCIDDTTCNKI